MDIESGKTALIDDFGKERPAIILRTNKNGEVRVILGTTQLRSDMHRVTIEARTPTAKRMRLKKTTHFYSSKIRDLPKARILDILPGSSCPPPVMSDLKGLAHGVENNRRRKRSRRKPASSKPLTTTLGDLLKKRA